MSDVKLFQGDEMSLETLSDEQLTMVQYSQEKLYANAIKSSAPFSAERARITREAYFVVDQFVDERNERSGGNSYGANSTFISLLTRIIKRQKKLRPQGLSFFEAGVGTGLIIEAASKIKGLKVWGCDAYLNDSLKAAYPHLIELPVYDALGKIKDGSIDVFYWNDVLEHLPVDEIDGLLDRIFQKLSPGGVILTITPYRHTGPHDITRLAAPNETEAQGLHLHEYSYGELQRLYRRHHFVPYGNIFSLPKRPYYCSYAAPRLLNSIRAGSEALFKRIPCRKPIHTICYRFCLNTSVFAKPARR